MNCAIGLGYLSKLLHHLALSSALSGAKLCIVVAFLVLSWMVLAMHMLCTLVVTVIALYHLWPVGRQFHYSIQFLWTHHYTQHAFEYCFSPHHFVSFYAWSCYKVVYFLYKFVVRRWITFESNACFVLILLCLFIFCLLLYWSFVVWQMMLSSLIYLQSGMPNNTGTYPGTTKFH